MSSKQQSAQGLPTHFVQVPVINVRSVDLLYTKAKWLCIEDLLLKICTFITSSGKAALK